MPINCLIIDDEPLAVDLLRSYADQIEDLHVIGQCHNAVEAIHLLQHEEVDLIILDIQMPGMTGFEMLKTLRHKPLVIFITAYREYAVQAFEMEAIDYLVKPVSFERFLKAINRAHTILIEHGQTADSKPFTEEIQAPRADEEYVVYVRSGHRMLKVDLRDVLYIESLKDYVSLHLPDKKIRTKQRISYLEETLPEKAFLRVHRSFLVAVNKITAFSSSEVEIDNAHTIPIGRSYRDQVSEFMRTHLCW